MGFLRRIGLAPGEIPTAEELERIQQSRERVRWVVRARWALLAIMAAFGCVAFLLFGLTREGAGGLPFALKAVPAAALLFVAGYNLLFSRLLHRIGGIRGLNKVQLLFDLVFVTLLVHVSGGSVSWFWSMYLVLTLETAFIMERRGDSHFIAAAGTLAYGALLFAESSGILPSVPVPFYHGTTLQSDPSYSLLKWAWMAISNLCVSWIGSYMMGILRTREGQLQELVHKDALTSLYNRRHFFLRLNSELQRARRYGRTFSLLLIDVDHFKRFNDTFGHPAGDQLLRGLAEVLQTSIRRSDAKPSYEVDIGCRYGGEEFAIILPEAASVGGAIAAERLRASIETRGALVVAERIRRQVEAARWEGRSVTVSIGVASYPEHGRDVESIVKAADDALYAAKSQGRNRVAVAAGGNPEH
jgi:diguanylate cyclase (GGDEF)-like protein